MFSKKHGLIIREAMSLISKLSGLLIGFCYFWNEAAVTQHVSDKLFQAKACDY